MALSISGKNYLTAKKYSVMVIKLMNTTAILNSKKAKKNFHPVG